MSVCICACSVMSDSCNLMDCSPPSPSVLGISLARILEWVAIWEKGINRKCKALCIISVWRGSLVIWSLLVDKYIINFQEILPTFQNCIPENTCYLGFSFLWKGFPGGSVLENPPASAGDAGDVGSIPGSGRVPREGNGNPLWYSCLEDPMDRGTWRATVHGVTKELDLTEHIGSQVSSSKNTICKYIYISIYIFGHTSWLMGS